MPLLIDAHLDLSWNALSYDRDLTENVDDINAREQGMTDCAARGHATVSLPEMRRGEIAVCLGTMLARARPDLTLTPGPGPKRVSLDYRSPETAYGIAHGQLALYRILQQQGHLALLNSAEQLQSHWKKWENPLATGNDSLKPVGLILAMEGADPIVSPQQVSEWFEYGLRVVNPVHYGHNQYAVGTGESGPLTQAGIALLKEFERVGMIVDATHLSDPSFFQAVDVFAGPMIASHQHCRTLAPNERQFSDEQLQLLIQRDAVIGAAFDSWMVIPNWKRGATPRSAVTLDHVVDHIDHICQLAGNHRHVAIGSDLDGGFGTEQVPEGIETIADLQKLAAVFERRGYSSEAIDAIFHGNWMRFFMKHLPKK